MTSATLFSSGVAEGDGSGIDDDTINSVLPRSTDASREPGSETAWGVPGGGSSTFATVSGVGVIFGSEAAVGESVGVVSILVVVFSVAGGVSSFTVVWSTAVGRVISGVGDGVGVEVATSSTEGTVVGVGVGAASVTGVGDGTGDGSILIEFTSVVGVGLTSGVGLGLASGVKVVMGVGSIVGVGLGVAAGDSCVLGDGVTSGVGLAAGLTSGDGLASISAFVTTFGVGCSPFVGV